MFKDYYLILGIGKDASPEKIEKAFNEAYTKLSDVPSSKEFQDAKEAFSVLSNQETKSLYDKELEAYNKSDDFANYMIKDPKLADTIGLLQRNKERTKSRNKSNVTRGCLWTFILIFIWMLSTCFRMILKQRNQNNRNSYSYVTPQKANKSCLQIITIY